MTPGSNGRHDLETDSSPHRPSRGDPPYSNTVFFRPPRNGTGVWFPAPDPAPGALCNHVRSWHDLRVRRH